MFNFLDLKRFSEMRWTKLTNIVDFPTGIAELDMTPYASGILIIFNLFEI